jgi:hypothetical protein
MAQPDGDLASALLGHFQQERVATHKRVLALVKDLSEEQLRWQSSRHAPSISFHVWHLARWADYDRSVLDGTPQIWQAQGLAHAWGFPTATLGEAETGTEMGDDAAERLVLPSKAALQAYARAAFIALDETLDRLPVESLLEPVPSSGSHDPLFKLAYVHLTHDNRHLGMIEALRGLLDLRGTATR